LARKPGRKTPLREPALRWRDNIKMNLNIGTKDVEWILLAQERVRSRVILNFIISI
jgi:hypothetical protein